MKIENKRLNTTFPVYIPDATIGTVKSLSTVDLMNLGTEGAVVNTYHLLGDPGTATLSKLGGIKKFMNFNGFVVSDSGGWQIFSLIHRSKNGGKITDDGVVFTIGKEKNKLFSPETSIKTQFDIGSDIVICLDDFTPPDADSATIKSGIDRTVLWAKKCKDEYLRQVETRQLSEDKRPILLSVIQGGFDKQMRKECADKLIEIGFDGYGYGGYAIQNGCLDLELSQYIAELIPNNSIKFALGVGTPHDIAMLNKYGWNIFDCTLPTRDARHGRLYVFNKIPTSSEDLYSREIYGHVNIARSLHREDAEPISEFCECHTCKNYSRAYLHHLFKIKEEAVLRLLSIHNIYTYNKLIHYLRSL